MSSWLIQKGTGPSLILLPNFFLTLGPEGGIEIFLRHFDLRAQFRFVHCQVNIEVTPRCTPTTGTCCIIIITSE